MDENKLPPEARKLVQQLKEILGEENIHIEMMNVSKELSPKDAIGDMIKKMMKGDGSSEPKRPENPKTESPFPGSKCDCEPCQTFDNFEKDVEREGLKGKFAYHEMELLGELFRVKYFLQDNGDEKLLVKKIEDHSEELDLEDELIKAIDAGDFSKAKDIIDLMKKFKK